MLALVTVDTPLDITDGDVSSLEALARARGLDGQVSLREAILAANNTPGQDAVQFHPSLSGVRVELTRTGANDDSGTRGDLDITDDMIISGSGQANTLVVATGLGDRVFHVQPGATVEIVGASISGGSVAGYGGGILVDGGSLTLRDSIVNTNAATNGAGIAVLSTTGNASLQVSDSRISGNLATQQGGGVGAFANQNGRSASITVLGSSVDNNMAQAGAGITSVASAGGKSIVAIEASTIADNEAQAPDGRGGGLFQSAVTGSGNHAIADLTISNSTISGNSSSSNGGGMFNEAIDSQEPGDRKSPQCNRDR